VRELHHVHVREPVRRHGVAGHAIKLWEVAARDHRVRPPRRRVRSLLARPAGRPLLGRTGCSFDPAGRGSCSTGDCGSGQVECNGAGADPPVTLIEFTLAEGSDGKDFYDVSLVDGYNLPVVVEATTTAINTASTTADTDTVGWGREACRSACEAFGTPEYCCSGEFGSPDTCRPSVYSQMFKSACPRSYSYAYDDATSTFTCATAAAADYVITFCPDSTVSQKSTKSSSPSKPSEAVFDDDSWIASLATGGVSAATRRRTFSIVEASLTIAAIICFLLH
ncbi:Thaumatin-like protein 1, partial [Ananas comosus]